MDLTAGLLLTLLVVLLGSIPALLLWKIRVRKKACLEMKRHLRRMDVPERA